MNKFIAFVCLFLLSTACLAQTGCACCSGAYHGFDFWVGRWDVYNANGNKIGENEVVRQESGCIVAEHWQGAQGGTGRSMNYYDPSDSSWNQLWVSSTNNILSLKGSASSDRMVMESALRNEVKDRITWTKNEDGTVTQQWERLDENDRPQGAVFKGIYKRKEE